MKLELIQSVNKVTPKTGSNAGTTMSVINGVHWSKTEPTREHTHVCLEDVDIEGKTYTNVIGFSSDTRKSVDEKIKMITEHDASYSQAIAMLLK